MLKSRFGEEVEEYQRLKSNATRRVYGSAFGHFLSFYQSKHGEGKGFSDYLDRIFEELKKPRRQQRRIAETELVNFINFLREHGKCLDMLNISWGDMFCYETSCVRRNRCECTVTSVLLKQLSLFTPFHPGSELFSFVNPQQSTQVRSQVSFQDAHTRYK